MFCLVSLAGFVIKVCFEGGGVRSDENQVLTHVETQDQESQQRVIREYIGFGTMG